MHMAMRDFRVDLLRIDIKCRLSDFLRATLGGFFKLNDTQCSNKFIHAVPVFADKSIGLSSMN